MNTLRSIIAAQYLTGSEATLSAVELARFQSWLTAQWAPLADLIRATPEDVSPDRFLSVWQAEGILLISMAHSEHPVWTVDLNVRFRAVHDWHHLQTDAGFGWEGELATYRYACQTAPQDIHWILRSEILGQAAATLSGAGFPEQKLVRDLIDRF